MGFPVVNYILGGTGDINYKLNIKEAIAVQFEKNGLFGIVAIPFLVYNFVRKVLS